jgi:cytochrome c-type biogenesis protein CcmH
MATVLSAVGCLAAAPLAPDQEERAQALFAEIRCVVCQNESIESSQAEIAADLRTLVREQVAADRSDAEIRAFLVERYGEFVLFRPAFSPGNAALWLTPFLLAGGGVAMLTLRSRTSRVPAPLSPEETARLAELQTTEPGEQKVI